MPPFPISRKSKQTVPTLSSSLAVPRRNTVTTKGKKLIAQKKFATRNAAPSSVKLVAGVPVSVKNTPVNFTLQSQQKQLILNKNSKLLRDKQRALQQRKDKQVKGGQPITNRNQKNFLGNVDDKLLHYGKELTSNIDFTGIGSAAATKFVEGKVAKIPGVSAVKQVSKVSKLKDALNDAGEIGRNLPSSNGWIAWVVVGGVVLFALLDD